MRLKKLEHIIKLIAQILISPLLLQSVTLRINDLHAPSTSPLLKALDRISISAVSGMGCIPGVAQQLNIDAVFSWSARADHGDLLKYIEKTGATTVVTYGRHAIELAAELQETHGKAAHALLQSPQMNLALD